MHCPLGGQVHPSSLLLLLLLAGITTLTRLFQGREGEGGRKTETKIALIPHSNSRRRGAAARAADVKRLSLTVLDADQPLAC